MKLEIHRVEKVSGSITVPGDKSISHRGLMLGAMAKGTTHIENLLVSEDILSTASCLRKMGVHICIEGNEAVIEGKGVESFLPYDSILDAGNSGTTIRLLLGLLAGGKNTYRFTGDDSLRKRPMGRVTIPLQQMGAQIVYLEKEGFLPLEIKGGQLEGIEYQLPVASAQVKSAILLAGLQSQGATVVVEPMATRDHTEIMVNYFGGDVQHQDGKIYIQGEQSLIGQRVLVPGDISSAAFFIVLGCITPSSVLTIENVGLNPTRTGLLEVLQGMGAQIEIINPHTQCGEVRGDIVVSTSSLKGSIIEGAMIPRLIDEIPILAVAACFAQGKTVIKDASELKVKESNRIEMMVSQLKKLGAQIESTEDGMIIHGGSTLKGAVVESAGDHRIAMALAIAATRAEGTTTIQGGDCVQVSFPGFMDTLNGLEV